MWKSLVDWWLDDLVQAELQTVFSIVGAILAGGAIVYAWKVARRQFKMMEDQDKIVKQQLATTKAQEGILKRIEGLQTAQGEIAQTQHNIMKEQLGRSAVLEIKLKFLVSDTGKPMWRIQIKNTGTKTASECAWNIYTPESLGMNVRVQKWDGSYIDISEERYDMGGGAVYSPHYGELRKSVYPDSEVNAATIVVHPQVAQAPEKFFPIHLKYSIRAEDGRFPADGFLDLTLKGPTTYLSQYDN